MMYRKINYEVMCDTRNCYETIPELMEAVEWSIANQFMVAEEDNIDQPIPDKVDVRFSNVVFENSRSKAYGSSNFKDRTVRGYSSFFELDSLSSARGIADSLSQVWPIDLNGTPRPPSGADAGCYQYKP